MSLYFKNKQGRIYHNDCLKTLDFLTRKGKKVDMILCDPPYGTTPFSWDKTLNMNEVWPFLKEIVKPHSAIVMTAYQPFTTMLINSNPDWFKYCWVWAKSKVGDVFNAKNKPLRKHEDIIVFSSGTTANCSDKRMPYYPQGLVNVNLTRKNGKKQTATFSPRPSHKDYYTLTQTGYPSSILYFKNESKTVHPTQKPLDLFKYLISTYTLEGQTVLDFCAGSCTTALACADTGRKFICIEKEEKYCKIGVNRMESFTETV